MLEIVGALKKRLNLRCCLLELFDATYIYEINDFVSMCMIALTTGINFEMPQINLIHKIDVRQCRPSCSRIGSLGMACSRSTSRCLPCEKWARI
jgi:hypothetical protein